MSKQLTDDVAFASMYTSHGGGLLELKSANRACHHLNDKERNNKMKITVGDVILVIFAILTFPIFWVILRLDGYFDEERL